jgi:hypothetical protein
MLTMQGDAAAYNWTALLQLLLDKHGVSPDSPDSDGCTPVRGIA